MLLLQALDEEYLKVDAQFGGVDQRKIFTFAEKVKAEACLFSDMLAKILLPLIVTWCPMAGPRYFLEALTSQQGTSTTPGILSLPSERLNMAHNRCQVSVRKGHPFGNFSPGVVEALAEGEGVPLGGEKRQSSLVCSGEETSEVRPLGLHWPFLKGRQTVF